MELEPIAWVLIATGVIVAGVSKGGFGASVGFLATPLMALAISPVFAVGVMLPILILIDQVGMAAYWRKWRWAAVWPVCLTACIGIGLGGFLIDKVDADALRLGLGVIAILFTLFQFARLRGWTPEAAAPRWLRAAIWGTASGFTSTISHAGGPPVTMYLLGERLDKTTYQGCSVLVFWVINLVKLPPYFMVGAIGWDTLQVSLWMAPVAVLGVGLGVWLHKRVSERRFFQFMFTVLVIVGLKLCWDGATALWGGAGV